ncbi:MAG: FtsL-like putative cell division protein [Salibacteraceae bacterium]|jgi:hypothetical protein|nr:FtsL-like putative cell division protein [Salibacteraceae bacterium]MDP4686809.1 FtsL-like putative cell division protein [Salibacteraceae bacterium]MDP4763117.1 FtsL-like putative cell division protein [Salibacteraceae bacterium]MDP4844699.1 FtsL-like putative cell division protein [Salibacteraceae bacterium]MDP4934615.1 FtsL-like putative cell division protein [Salibacteraceae bacterium]
MEPKAEKKEKKQNAFAALMSGNLLTQDVVVKHLPFTLFLAGFGLVYIANGYLAESLVRSISKTQIEIKELRSEQISIKSELNNTIIESELKKIISDRSMGLEESFDPPKKIEVSSKELNSIN